MNRSKEISLGAMVTVISLILIYATTIFPTSRIFLIALASYLGGVLVIEIGKRAAILSFVSTSILGMIVIPNKLVLLPFISFLGYYALIKLYIENLNNIILEWVLKLLVFNVAVLVNYMMLTNIIAKGLEFPFSIALVFLSLNLVFLIYDYVFTMFIDHYKTKVRKYIK